MKQFLILLLLAGCLPGRAQEDEQPDALPMMKLNSGSRLYGKITDSQSGRGLEAITVQLFARVPAGASEKDSLVASMFTQSNGDFSFSGLPAADSFLLSISAAGYQVRQQAVAYQAGRQLDLGNIALEVDVQQLAGVTVIAQRSALEMGIDRKVFHVDRSLTATGGTAIDVMKNIPSVSVDVEGNVQLRNSAPQIFVDGRPTILTLDQIPADAIERVELITNPSARFDAASTGGIINVVMKRNKRVGLNGVATAGGGYPGAVNGNINLNARQGKFNFFISSGINRSGGKASGRTERTNKADGRVENYFNQSAVSERIRQFFSTRFGVDYFLDNRNTLSLTQGIVNGRFTNREEQAQVYLNSNQTAERFGRRTSEGRSAFRRYNTQLNFTHKFTEPGKELTANVNYNYGNGENRSDIFNSFTYPDGVPFSDPARVRNEGANSNDQVTFQVDYVNPRGEEAKFETGVRSYINRQNNLLSTFALVDGRETKLPLSSNYAFSELINAYYITYSDRWKGIGYQAGLRAEHSRFNGELVDSARKFGYEYPSRLNRIFDALFPSLFLTRQVGEAVELQLNYTRRIRRPNFWQLNPFIDINDPVNISQGNPALRPEYTNSIEFNYSHNLTRGNVLGVLYYRNNQGDITRYSDTISAERYQQLNNAAVDPNAIFNTFINARSTNTLGAEVTWQYKVSPVFDITPTANLQYRMVNAGAEGLNLSNEGVNWEAKLIANYKIETERPSLFGNLGFQLIAEYESPQVVPQGRELGEFGMDVALRKEFLKDKKAALTFGANNILRTERWGSIYDTEQFYQYAFRRDIRSFRLTFTYKFGSSEFALFRRDEERGNDDD